MPIAPDQPVTAAPAPAKSLSAEQVASTLGVPLATLGRWAEAGLIGPCGDGYDFRDLVALRTITTLVEQGASPAVIKRSVRGLSKCFKGVERPLSELNIVVSDKGRLVAQLDDALLAPGG